MMTARNHLLHTGDQPYDEEIYPFSKQQYIFLTNGSPDPEVLSFGEKIALHDMVYSKHIECGLLSHVFKCSFGISSSSGPETTSSSPDISTTVENAFSSEQHAVTEDAGTTVTDDFSTTEAVSIEDVSTTVSNAFIEG